MIITRLSVDVGNAYTAEAASKEMDSKFLSSIQPVKLDSKLERMYEDVFFARSRTIFVNEMMKIGTVTHKLNAFIAAMRKLLVYGRMFDNYAAESSERLSEEVNLVFDDAIGFIEQSSAGKRSALEETVMSMIESTMSGNRHIIKRSEVYTGGVDVVMMRGRDDTSLMCSDISYGDFLASNPESPTYSTERYQAYYTEFSLKVKQAMEEILTYVFGSNRSSAGTSTIVTLPLTFDYPEIQKIFERITGIVLHTQFFQVYGGSSVELTSKKNKKALSNIENFIRPCFVLAPEATAAAAIKRSLRDSYDLPPHELAASMPSIRESAERGVTDEAKLFNRKITSTMTFTFNKPMASYICQDENEINFVSFNNWFSIWSSRFLRKPHSAKNKSLTGRNLRRSEVPRYALPVSQLKGMSELRRSLNMHVESTRGNADGLHFNTNGTMAYLPTTEQRDSMGIAEEYERLSGELYQFCADYGISQSLLTMDFREVAHYDIPHELWLKASDAYNRLSRYTNVMLGFDWDTGLRITTSHIPGVLRSHIETGAARVDDLAIADYLGYNLAPEGERPIQKTFADSMMLMTSTDPLNGEFSVNYGSESSPSAFITTPVFKQIVEVYTYHAAKGDLPKLPELLTSVAREIGLDSAEKQLRESHDVVFDSATLTLAPAYASQSGSQSAQHNIIGQLLAITLNEASGAYGSYLYNKHRGDGAVNPNLQEDIMEDPNYFLANKSPANHFARTAFFFGGAVYKRILELITTLDVDKIMNLALPVHVKDGQVTYDFDRPSNFTITSTVLPHALMFGKYTHNYAEIEAKADESIESIKKDTSVTEEDVHFAGSSSKFALFPHQLDSHKFLRKAKPPKFAVLDIAPGGGKTAMGLSDMASIAKDLESVGRVRPLVLCPDNLVRNWCDDMKDFSGGSWNMIPITTETFDRWGADELRKLIEGAPVNTIVVAGFNFLSGRPTNIVIGNTTVRLNTNLEFIRSFEFNYIIIDESHKLKSLYSQRHKVVKQLTTSSFVQYLRIATGTLIADRVRDIEGQVALYSPHIFRSGELSEATDNMMVNGEKVDMWRVGTPQEARTKLSRYAAVITKKKKDWAFMLPSPIEQFHAVGFYNDDEESVDVELGKLHEELYNTVVEESIEQLEKLLVAAKHVKNDDDDGDSDGDSDDSMEIGSGDEFATINAAELEAYLQRIERLIIAPEFDPLYETVFGKRKYVSRKAKTIANLVKKHFNVDVWEKGKHYNEHTQVKHNGKLYVSRKVDGTDYKRALLPEESIGVPPDSSEFWREEPEGKIIIFCRYTNSVNAVFNALPEEYAKMAVKFTGEEANKYDNLERFKKDKNIKIIVANEQGLSEGHNLQMASRLIRVESPWGPGELDQSASRIFRPDPKGASEGNIYRETVMLDWVLANNTMEVAKQARLIAKIISKAQFDEAENPRYAEVLENSLEEVSMGLKLLRTRPSLDEYGEYVNAYAHLNSVIRAEFHEMRTKMSTELIPVPQTPPLQGARKINVPFIRQQDIPDPNNWKPSSVAAIVNNDEGVGARIAADPESAVGMPAITDHGNGMIVNVTKRRNSNSISSIQVKIKETDEIIRLDPGLVFIPTTIKAADVKKEFETSLSYTQAQLRREAREQRELEELEAQAEIEAAAAEQREKRRARARAGSVERGNIRKKNEAEGKPINKGVRAATTVPVAKGVKADATFEEPITISPAYYHGYLTLESDNLDQAKVLKKYGFKEFGAYAFVTIKRRNQANAVMDYIEDNFELSPSTVDRLSAVFAAFQKGKRGLYLLELAPSSELPHFFALNKRIVKNRKEARIYPMFKDDELILMVDIRTSPIIKKHMNRAIPGAATKWQMAPGALIYFAKNKADLKTKVAAMKRGKVNIMNVDILDKEITAIKYRAPKKKPERMK